MLSNWEGISPWYVCVYCKKTPTAIYEGLWDPWGHWQTSVALPRDVGPLFKFSPESSAHAWAILEENWSPAELQPCLRLAMDPVDPDPDLQTAFPAWPQSCLVTLGLPGYHWTLSSPWPVDLLPRLTLSLPGHRDTAILLCPAHLAQAMWQWPSSDTPAQTPGDPPQHHIPQGTAGPWCSLRHGLCSLAVVPWALRREGPCRKREPTCRNWQGCWWSPREMDWKEASFRLGLPRSSADEGGCCGRADPSCAGSTLLVDSAGRTMGSWPLW